MNNSFSRSAVRVAVLSLTVSGFHVLAQTALTLKEVIVTHRVERTIEMKLALDVSDALIGYGAFESLSE